MDKLRRLLWYVYGDSSFIAPASEEAAVLPSSFIAVSIAILEGWVLLWPWLFSVLWFRLQQSAGVAFLH